MRVDVGGRAAVVDESPLRVVARRAVGCGVVARLRAWQADHERRALSACALGMHIAMVQVDVSLDERQPDARAAYRAARLVEPLEDMRQILRVDVLAVVADAHLEALAVA